MNDIMEGVRARTVNYSTSNGIFGITWSLNTHDALQRIDHLTSHRFAHDALHKLDLVNRARAGYSVEVTFYHDFPIRRLQHSDDSGGAPAATRRLRVKLFMGYIMDALKGYDLLSGIARPTGPPAAAAAGTAEVDVPVHLQQQQASSSLPSYSAMFTEYRELSDDEDELLGCHDDDDDDDDVDDNNDIGKLHMTRRTNTTNKATLPDLKQHYCDDHGDGTNNNAHFNDVDNDTTTTDNETRQEEEDSSSSSSRNQQQQRSGGINDPREAQYRKIVCRSAKKMLSDELSLLYQTIYATAYNGASYESNLYPMIVHHELTKFRDPQEDVYHVYHHHDNDDDVGNFGHDATVIDNNNKDDKKSLILTHDDDEDDEDDVVIRAILTDPIDHTITAPNNAINDLPFDTQALLDHPCFDKIQHFLSRRFITVQEDPPPLDLAHHRRANAARGGGALHSIAEDDGISDEPLERMLYLLKLSIVEQERLSNSARDEKGCRKYGSVGIDLQTSLHQLSVYDPKTNPEGIVLFPTILPSHVDRLWQWFSHALPPLKQDLQYFHLIHIDSEGDYFQLHVEDVGCLIIYAGLTNNLITKFENELYKYGLSGRDDLASIDRLGKYVMRKWTISRNDVVFGGDMAACPFSHLAEKTRRGIPPNSSSLEWKKKWSLDGPRLYDTSSSDIGGWMQFVLSEPNDFVQCRGISLQEENRIMALPGTCGLKSVVMCALATERGLDSCINNNNSSCLCEQLYDKRWLNSRQCTYAHPNLWHKFPQSHATIMKNLTAWRNHWSILYYAISDLVKARALSLCQKELTIHTIKFGRRHHHQSAQ
ncbi:hypothetical protein FOZ60_001269 [Perkinsus olseni]|uniref:Uncharacterized protein n=2 Tax=Perkinsus olseni TaxID=32597 RepID=A0A7J6P1L0_PEROL|nr:hypothetical protein FOZ60_001269 [Perkinsus olseni]